ncbi:DUF898 domain-containing protein [Microvirga rosea]|uniref:DUF898 domain-containing protein n=1 Tax=Microvirga rosea TaxID=2715425 RepID=UPI001D0A0EB6|nr:DUF898 domain-containing protein [Microvirga rosea]MCB8820235.1 DUF898 domain-containing protein [Microvirga rosea]
MTTSLASTIGPAVPEAVPMSFSGRGREFLKILIAGSLFQIPTFGFYRFWLITKMRRHLWSNTQVAGEAFEYAGTAKELLIGFFIALAVLTPLYLAYFILGLMLEEKHALASIPLVIVMYVLAHFGSYRARRYRATRTIFRGMRFWMTGKGWAYAGRAILWDLATILTLGLALPWASASLERYRMRHTFFGTLQGDFTGSGWTLFKRGVWVWALGIVLVVGLPVGFAAFLHKQGDPAGLWANLTPPFIILLAFLALWPIAMAIFARWQLEGIRFGEVTVSSQLRKRAFVGVFLKLIFSSLAFMICFGLGIALVGFIFKQQILPLLVEFNTVFTHDSELVRESMPGIATVVVVAALLYLVLLLGLGVIQRYFIGRGLWAVMVNSVSVANLPALDAAVAAGQPSGVLGEGLADALDFNVGL